MIIPITPQEARERAANSIPSCIIEAVNNLLASKIGNGKEVILKQDDILEAAGANKDKPEFRQQIFDNKWLDIENLYAKFGWNVTYDGPGYNETYSPTFKFRAND